jgi:hypothetical protein
MHKDCTARTISHFDSCRKVFAASCVVGRGLSARLALNVRFTSKATEQKIDHLTSMYGPAVQGVFRRSELRFFQSPSALNPRVPGSSPGAATTQSPETRASKSASEKAAFAAISRAWLSPIFGPCAEISSLRLFRSASLRRQKSRSRRTALPSCVTDDPNGCRRIAWLRRIAVSSASLNC